MPRRTHTQETRPVTHTHATYSDLYDELHKQWSRWRQSETDKAKARQQEQRIAQFRNTYTN